MEDSVQCTNPAGANHMVYLKKQQQQKTRKILGAKLITWFAWNISNAKIPPAHSLIWGSCCHCHENNSIYSEAAFFELITDYLVLFAGVGEGSAGLVALCGSLMDQFLADWKSNTKASTSCIF